MGYPVELFRGIHDHRANSCRCEPCWGEHGKYPPAFFTKNLVLWRVKSQITDLL